MFKWLKKQYKRYKLNNKSYMIKDNKPYSHVYEFLHYKPGKSTIKNAYTVKDNPTLFVVVNSNKKRVFIERMYDRGSFSEVSGDITNDILDAYDRYVEELQELEML